MEGIHGSISHIGVQKVVQSGQSNPIRCRDWLDKDGNPASGYAHGVGMSVVFQDGPRGKLNDGTLAPASGAFVEDLLVAAMQRLAFFQQTKFAHDKNAEAIEHLHRAIDALDSRAKERARRGVLGENTV